VLILSTNLAIKKHSQEAKNALDRKRTRNTIFKERDNDETVPSQATHVSGSEKRAPHGLPKEKNQPLPKTQWPLQAIR